MAWGRWCLSAVEAAVSIGPCVLWCTESVNGGWLLGGCVLWVPFLSRHIECPRACVVAHVLLSVCKEQVRAARSDVLMGSVHS